VASDKKNLHSIKSALQEKNASNGKKHRQSAERRTPNALVAVLSGIAGLISVPRLAG